VASARKERKKQRFGGKKAGKQGRAAPKAEQSGSRLHPGGECGMIKMLEEGRERHVEAHGDSLPRPRCHSSQSFAGLTVYFSQKAKESLVLSSVF